MTDLKKNYIDMSKNSGRTEGAKKMVLDSVNLEILDKADKKKSGRTKAISFSMNKQLKRNDNMYQHGEWYKNCVNEKKNDQLKRLKDNIKIYEAEMKRNKIFEQDNS